LVPCRAVPCLGVVGSCAVLCCSCLIHVFKIQRFAFDSMVCLMMCGTSAGCARRAWRPAGSRCCDCRRCGSGMLGAAGCCCAVLGCGGPVCSALLVVHYACVAPPQLRIRFNGVLARSNACSHSQQHYSVLAIQGEVMPMPLPCHVLCCCCCCR
jgi:hypothetical protein